MRRQSREIALQILFQAEFNPQKEQNFNISGFSDLLDEAKPQDTYIYADELVKGVLLNQNKIDSLIKESSAHWKIDRMSTVDRNVLRIATYEMSVSPLPLKKNIVINEAIEVAKKYGATDSSGFVNGILDQIAKRN